MKKILIILTITSLSILSSCNERGTTHERLTGHENSLPPELKGLKIYSVYAGYGDYVKVGVMNNKVIGNTYSHGKSEESIILVNQEITRTIEIETIISENDSILVIKKKTYE